MSELTRAPIGFGLLRTRCPRCKGQLAPCDPRYEDGVAFCLSCGHRFYLRQPAVSLQRRDTERRVRLPVGEG